MLHLVFCQNKIGLLEIENNNLNSQIDFIIFMWFFLLQLLPHYFYS